MSDSRLRICIVGGGSLGHVVAGFLAARHDVRVSVLTRRPALWGDVVTVTDLDGKVYDGSLRNRLMGLENTLMKSGGSR